MKRILIAFVSGLLFGIGLILSGMGNPKVVQSFLDPFGDWNPALMWVMVGALCVSFVGVVIARKRKKTLTGEPLEFPQNSKIDKNLIFGGLIFGAGWGMVGICPGPALVLLGRGLWEGVLFVIAMLIGMKLVSFVKR